MLPSSALARALLILVPLAGCTVADAESAKRARTEMIGMSEPDLLLCAGIPTRTKQLAGAEYQSYEHAGDTGGINLTVPVVGGGVNVTGGGYCTVTFKMVDGKVAAVGFGGDNDSPLSPDAVCGPIVADCLSKPAQQTPVTQAGATSSITGREPN